VRLLNRKNIMGNCYLCKSDKSKVRHRGVREDPEINVMECENCGLVFLDTFEQITEHFYQTSQMHGDKQISMDEWLTETAEDDERRFELLKENINGKNLLDFGCGAGGFLRKCKLQIQL